jgi:hypothetical protein
LGQPIKAAQIGTAHKTVALLNPRDGLFSGLTLYPFMPTKTGCSPTGEPLFSQRSLGKSVYCYA